MRVPWLWSHGMVGVGPLLFLILRPVLSLPLYLRFKLLVRCSCGSSAACEHVWQACLAAVPLVLVRCVAVFLPPLLLCVCGVGPGCIFGEGFLHVPPL